MNKEILKLLKEHKELTVKELIEKLEDTEPWRAYKNYKYYYLGDCGYVMENIEVHNVADFFRWVTGNYFKTRKEAEEHKNKLMTYSRLKLLVKRLNGGEKIDWYNSDQRKYTILYHCGTGILYQDEECSIKLSRYCQLGEVYCLSSKFLEIAKKEIGEENLLKLFEGDDVKGT